MSEELRQNYERARENGWFYETKRGLIKVWGKESAQFLNGLITGDPAKLVEDAEMLAAFPNAQGRLLAVIRVIKRNDAFFFETEETTREKVFQNLFRFTFAGDFFVEDLSEKFQSFELCAVPAGILDFENFRFETGRNQTIFVPEEQSENFKVKLASDNAIEVSDELYEILRIENGAPKYGVDMDETTIVPELGIDGLINYNKGCYIGQEIIARIYFRGHVAKKMTGLIFEDENTEINPNDELKSLDGKNAGKITSVTFSPEFGKKIALGFVRYDFLAEGTELKIGDLTARVKNLPFV